MRRLLPLAALALLPACANDATGVVPPKTLIIEASVEGERFVQRADLAYYLVLDTDGDPATVPLVNGPAPAQYPFPDPRAYLPFVRDERAVADRDDIQVPNTTWDRYIALHDDGAGQWACRMGRRNADGSVTENFRELQKGREWAFKDARTLQLQLPFTLLRPDGAAEDFQDPAQLDANLAVARRAEGGSYRDFTIERWGRVQNASFQLETRPINQNLYDTVSGVTFPQNLPSGVDPRDLNFTSLSYRVVAEGR